jgi:hypothetical protein
LISGLFCCSIACQLHYGGAWSILDETMWSLTSPRARRISRTLTALFDCLGRESEYRPGASAINRECWAIPAASSQSRSDAYKWQSVFEFSRLTSVS